jgi:hypothetical protein
MLMRSKDDVVPVGSRVTSFSELNPSLGSSRLNDEIVADAEAADADGFAS